MRLKGRDHLRKNGRSREVPDTVREDYIIVGRPSVGREIGDGECGVEFYSRAQWGGEDVCLGVFEGWGAVVWGAGVDGIDMSRRSNGVR